MSIDLLHANFVRDLPVTLQRGLCVPQNSRVRFLEQRMRYQSAKFKIYFFTALLTDGHVQHDGVKYWLMRRPLPNQRTIVNFLRLITMHG